MTIQRARKVREKKEISEERTQLELETDNGEQQLLQKKKSSPESNPETEKTKKRPGKQPGAQGKWRSQPLVAEITIPHYPEHCAACNQELRAFHSKPYMGHYVLELEKGESGFRVICQLHHYYQATCSCGHISRARPGEGRVSVTEGRSRDLKLTEYVLVGPLLTTLIASLGVRYRLSRAKISEFLRDWVGIDLSIGTIDRCIREAGIACSPVVEELVEQLQQVEVLHLDETPWYVRRRTLLALGRHY